MMGGHECYGSKQGGERDYCPILKFAADPETWLLHILQKIYEKWGRAIEMSQNPIISLFQQKRHQTSKEKLHS